MIGVQNLQDSSSCVTFGLLPKAYWSIFRQDLVKHPGPEASTSPDCPCPALGAPLTCPQLHIGPGVSAPLQPVRAYPQTHVLAQCLLVPVPIPREVPWGCPALGGQDRPWCQALPWSPGSLLYSWLHGAIGLCCTITRTQLENKKSHPPRFFP